MASQAWPAWFGGVSHGLKIGFWDNWLFKSVCVLWLSCQVQKDKEGLQVEAQNQDGSQFQLDLTNLVQKGLPGPEKCFFGDFWVFVHGG